MAIALSNLAGVFLSFPNRLNEAEDYFNQAWAVFEEIGWYHLEAEIRQGIGIVQYNRGNYKQAIQNYLLSTQLNDKFNRGPAIRTTNYNLLSRTYEKMGDFKTALEYNKLFVQSSDSLDQKDKYDKLINLEKQYETEKKENELIRLQAKQELTSLQLANNKKLKTLAIITATLLFLFVIFILLKYFEKIKSNELLERKNQQIEKSENELRLLNASKNKFFSIIAHDLKNPLHTIIGYSELLSKENRTFTDTERTNFAKNINKSTNSLYRLLQNLLEWSKTQTGNLRFTPIEFEISKVIENPINIIRQMAENKNISIIMDYEGNLKVFADPLMIETVLRNLLSNAIKFTHENGQVEIIIRQSESLTYFSIKDSGIGISKEDAENLFRIDSKVKRKGTNNEEGTGIGLLLCKEFVELNHGTISVVSEPNKGSTFIFTLPSATKQEVNAKVELIEQASA
jgi:signal transduction histidine kinase